MNKYRVKWTSPGNIGSTPARTTVSPEENSGYEGMQDSHLLKKREQSCRWFFIAW